MIKNLPSFLSFLFKLSHVYCHVFLTGTDPVVSTFEICDLNSDGLTKEELLQDNCKETLGTWFGFTEKGLNEIFPEVDGNADGRISMHEGRLAYESFALFNRKGGTSECPTCDCPFVWP